MSKRQRNRRAKRLRHAPVAALTVGAALAAPAVSQASQFDVTNNDDSASPITGSLRKAITDAENHSGADDIVINVPYSPTINLQASLPTITQQLTITNANPLTSPVTINGAGIDDSIFKINTTSAVSISGLTLENGGGPSVTGGGAINSGGADLTVQDSTLTGNTAVTGGTIRQSHGSVTIDNTTITDGQAAARGGALYAYNAAVHIQNGSTLGGNQAYYGGGLAAQYGSLEVTNSTVSGNHAQYAAGLGTYQATGTINASTISGNIAAATGGGLYTYISPLVIFNSTITGNSAASGGGIADFASNSSHLHAEGATVANNAGGGIAENGAPGNEPMTLLNSIVACSTTGSDLSVSGGMDPVGTYYSLIQTAPSSAFDGHGHTITGQNPLLGPLADNGGNTQTLALAAGSPAIDHGATTLAEDQRGEARPGTGADIGAFERQPGDGAVTPAQCGPAPPSNQTPGPITTPSTTQPLPAAIVKVGKFKAGKNAISVTVSCASAACSGNVALNTLEKLKGKQVVGLAKKLKTKRLKVGSKAYALAAGQTKTITVKLNAKGKKLLTRYRKMKVRVSVSQRKATGSQVVKTGKVTLKSKPKKKR